MIFPSESLYALRRELLAKIHSGELSDAEAFGQALEADPDDRASLRVLALLAEKAGDHEAAERYARRFVQADPISHDSYIVLAKILNRLESFSPLSAAYAQLGMEKMRFDPEAVERLDVAQLAASFGVPEIWRELPKARALDILIAALNQAHASEPAAVTWELEPHRLLQQMYEIGVEAMDRALVDRILVRAADSAPLLLGVLNAYGEELMRDEDDPLVVRALALLGEIGGPAALPALLKFVTLSDETLAGTARWACQRLSFQHPAEALEIMRQMTGDGEALDLAGLAQQICMMPKVPGRAEALSGIAGRVQDFPKEGAELVVLSVITSALVMQGGNSELAVTLEKRYAAGLSREARSELKRIRAEFAGTPAHVADKDEFTVHDLCCEEFEAVDEAVDEADSGPAGLATVVLAKPKSGRNDPCWCGSGKKYKKCHLERDQSR
jgi:tetratricopeptide (TPR) repeat protein